MSTLGEILSKLNELTPDEQEQLRKKLALLRDSSGSSGTSCRRDPEKETDEQLVLDCIIIALNEKGLEIVPNARVLRASTPYKSFREKVPPVMEYLRRSIKKRNDLRAVLIQGILLLYDNLVEMGVPVSSRTILSHIHRIPAVLNRSFPGYAASGMLGMIAVKEKKSHVRTESSDEAVPERGWYATRKQRVRNNPGRGS